MRSRNLVIAFVLALVLTSGAASAAFAAPPGPSGSPIQVAQDTHHASLHHAVRYDNWWACTPSNTPGYQCDNTDPVQTGCSNTQTFRASGNGVVNGSKWQVQLWYSTACGTIWAKLLLLSGSNSCYNCELDVVRHNYDYSVNDGLSVGGQGQTIYSGAWTNQLYLPCGNTLVGDADLYVFNVGTVTWSNDWSSC